MSDVAQLGIQVTNKGVKENTDGLEKLSGAAARAEAATDGLAGANRGAVGAASAAAKAYANEGAAAASASKQIEMANRAANQNTAGLVRTHNTGNLAAQGFDIVTTAAGGMSAGLIGMQQGLQIAQVAMLTTDGFAKTLGASLIAMLSPITLIAVGLTTLVAVLIQAVSWTKLAQSALNGLADILVDIAPYAVAAAAAVALLYAPAIIGGIISLIALLGRLVVQLALVAAAFIAANPVVAFIAGITLAVAAANIFRDELAQLFGRDIVADAKTGVNLVIGSFVGGYEAIKAVWAMLPAALSDVVYSTAQKVIDGIESMVQSAIDGLNNLINKYALWTASIGKPLSPETYNGMILGPVEFGSVSNPNPGAGNAALETAVKAIKGAQGVDYVGGVTDAIGRGASAASEKLKELAKGLTDVDAKAKKKSGGKSDTEKYSDIVDGAERRIAALDAERNALGLSEEAAAALRYETEFLNQAQQRGITLTAVQKGELSALAQVMAQTEAETKKMGEAIEFSKELTKGFFDDFFSGLENGKSVWESFGDAALGVLSKISDKLLNDVVDALFEVNKAGAGSGGGLLSGILGLFGGGQMGIAKAGGIGMYAAGTPAARPGVAWVGEKGPELVRFKGGEEVIPNHRVVSAANQNAGASNAPVASDGAREIVLRVIGEEGPMFRPTIRSESEGVVVQGIRDYDSSRENLYQNGQAR
ncbi:phage tail tape-measure protein [Pararhizobium sp. PWRC1-1]|uniref:phage tail tape-measure protein n=1 Tax=Pararhizobium sp. PWRC1-1 TaxID=2804566 RepID=UPI003CF22362